MLAERIVSIKFYYTIRILLFFWVLFYYPCKGQNRFCDVSQKHINPNKCYLIIILLFEKKVIPRIFWNLLKSFLVYIWQSNREISICQFQMQTWESVSRCIWNLQFVSFLSAEYWKSKDSLFVCRETSSICSICSICSSLF